MENAVLYALSTAAQTCAALAALVGALALYRLQSMRDANHANELRMRGLLAGNVMNAVEAQIAPMEDIIRMAQANRDPKTGASVRVTQGLTEALTVSERFATDYASGLRLLLIFEA